MYRTIDASFWTDPKVRKLSPDGRNLFLYLITNPHTHVSGIYYLPISTISHETGISIRELNTLLDTLFTSGFCQFDWPTETIWIKNMMRYQGKGEKNLISAAHHISKDLHKSPLISAFIERYPEIKRFVPDTLSIGNAVDATPDSPFLIPEQENRTHIPDCAPPALDAGFEKLWLEYPSKDGKKQAKKFFDSTVKTTEDIVRCETSLRKYLDHMQLHPQKQFKNGSTWFSNWQDWEHWKEPERSNGNGLHHEPTEEERAAARKYWTDQGITK